MGDTSETASTPSSLPDHKDDCPLHDDSRNGLCHALTNSGKLCSCRAKITRPGYLPVCKTHDRAVLDLPDCYHAKKVLRAGKCQAIEDCGQLCNRVAQRAAPYHLCTKHQMGSNTLPCHLMELPTELRLMIMRYLFPEDIMAHQSGVKVAILKTSRQLYQEASSVLYGESQFTAGIYGQTDIALRGKIWKRIPFSEEKSNDYSVHSVLCSTSIGMIRNLKLEIHVGAKRSRSKVLGGILQEDYELYMTRDSVRKLTDCLSYSGLNVLRTLKVTATLFRGYNWSQVEVANALFFILEPLQSLHVEQPLLELEHAPSYGASNNGATATAERYITGVQSTKAYIKLQEQWLKALTDPDSIGKPAPIVGKAYRKIEAFAQLIRAQALASPKCWTSTVFQNLERPLHFARVAYENGDGEMLDKINEAVNLRWVIAHRQQQKSLQDVADSINAIFEQDQDSMQEGFDSEDEADDFPTPRELYPDAYEFECKAPLKQTYATVRTQCWDELDSADSAPKRNEPGVTVRMDGLRYTICKDGKEWSRLKTPALIRDLKREKAAAAQAI